MLFHVSAIARDRSGTAYRDPKPGAKPMDAAGNYSDADTRDSTHGAIAMMALDVTLPSDQKELQAEPAKWVKKVSRRDSIAKKIEDALAGDGWAELSDLDERDVVVDRLAECLSRPGVNNAMIGPVIRALNSPPISRPAIAAMANGKDTEATAGLH